MDKLPAALLADIQAIKSQAPVVLNLTNFVAMDLSANALLALGASPIMSHAKEELPELIRIASSVVLNIGTLDSGFLASCVLALSEAGNLRRPVVLDPVGAGATQFRTDAARSLLKEEAVTVLRGNASEIAAVLTGAKNAKGVDSALSTQEVFDAIKTHSINHPFVITVSGETDYVFLKGEVGTVTLSCPMMTKVTAMGCTASALVAAFLAVNPSPFHAALHAMTAMGMAGEIAKQSSSGPGSFRVAFIDALSSLGGQNS